MWTHEFEARSSLAASQLWGVLADVARWPEIDASAICQLLGARMTTVHELQPQERGGG